VTGHLPRPVREGRSSREGRVLAWAEYGPATGRPLLFLPGAGSGRLVSFGSPELQRRDVRLISIDRAGIGNSDFDPQKSVESVADDIRHISHECNASHAPLVAHSQAAPFALAAARKGTCSRLVLVSPIDEVAHPRNRALLPSALSELVLLVEEDRGGARAKLERLGARRLVSLILDSSDPQIDPVFVDPRFRQDVYRCVENGVGDGRGYAQDTLIAMSRWLMPPPTVPVRIAIGDSDDAHAFGHGEGLASQWGATRHIVRGAGASLLWSHATVIIDLAFR